MAPQVAEYRVRRGVVHLALSQRSLAVQDFDAAVALDPAHEEARLRRLRQRIHAGDRADSLADLEALDGSLAPQANRRLEMSQFYNTLDLQDRALAQLNHWIAAHPHDAKLAGALNGRCWARTMLNTELDKALDDCDKAIKLNAKEAYYFDSRAWLRLRQGEPRKALADFDRALKLKPDSAWSLYGRGITRGKLGDAAAGLADLDAARKLRPAIDAETGRHGLAADPKT